MNKIRELLYEIIFGTDTLAGKTFDVFLLITIIFSVLIFMLESITSIDLKYGYILNISEWVITIIFTVEYILRIIVTRKSLKYITSFFGVIDLLSVLPTYIAILISGTHFLAIVRALRLLRVFRILKISLYVDAGNTLLLALKASKRKIGVFLYTIVIIVVIVGTLMYYVEGAENGFTSIPRAIYWAIVTLTTVGYGDISPQTNLGQFIASIIMILGYAIIAVPTGIVSAEMVSANERMNNEKSLNTENNSKKCKNCDFNEHDIDAKFCKKCGETLQAVDSIV